MLITIQITVLIVELIQLIIDHRHQVLVLVILVILMLVPITATYLIVIILVSLATEQLLPVIHAIMRIKES